MPTRPTINLGDQVKHTITGYTGIVVCIGNWLSGCQRVTVQSQELREGKPVENQTFDVEELELVKPDAAPTCKPTGGPCPAPTRNAP